MRKAEGVKVAGSGVLTPLNLDGSNRFLPEWQRGAAA
jgi:hypothetical protein